MSCTIPQKKDLEALAIPKVDLGLKTNRMDSKPLEKYHLEEAHSRPSKPAGPSERLDSECLLKGQITYVECCDDDRYVVWRSRVH